MASDAKWVERPTSRRTGSAPCETSRRITMSTSMPIGRVTSDTSGVVLSRRSGALARPARPRNQDLRRPAWLRRASSDARHWIHDPAEYVDSAASRPVCSHLGSFRGSPCIRQAGAAGTWLSRGSGTDASPRIVGPSEFAITSVVEAGVHSPPRSPPPSLCQVAQSWPRRRLAPATPVAGGRAHPVAGLARTPPRRER
jgi:hypothetical protein